MSDSFDIDSAVTGYLEAQLWVGLCLADSEDSEPYTIGDKYEYDDIPVDYITHVREDISEFILSNLLDVAEYVKLQGSSDYDLQYGFGQYSGAELFGHDYYLTREHHGAGFWDRGLGELGERLTSAAHSAGEAAYAYRGDFDGSLAFDY